MPWTCRIIDFNEITREGKEPRPGDMWYAPWMLQHEELSPQYRHHWRGKRSPVLVRLPNGANWCIDVKFSGSTHGWTVTGIPPLITVYPSVNIPGPAGYHGWLVNGFLTDDLEGRTYP